ncbi:MAG: LPXTG cell wall anchor domain-containing protein, partial [Nanoarchaeota archaeon]
NPPLNQPTTNQSAAGNTTSVNQPASTGNLPAQNSFFAGTTFKIILVIIILIVLGLIAYLILRKKNKSPAVSS